jgi:uncharacterized protein YlxW (UPF0749 family)
MPESARTPGPGTGSTAEQPDPVSGRDRLMKALRTPSRGQAVVAVLLAVLGFAGVVQVRANDRDQNFVGARQSDLIALINTLALATDRAESEIAELDRTREALRDDAESTQTALSVARERVEALGILAGTVPAVGPGIRVTVTSPTGTLGTDQLLNGLEELRNAGAEAIEINDSVRVVAQTGLVDSPSEGLLVDGVPVQTPYVIEAIGDPYTLATALDFDGGFIEEVENVDGEVQVEEVDSVEIASTSRVPEPTFAAPVEQE